MANAQDQKTFATLIVASTVFQLGDHSGIGFVFTDMDNYAFIEFDDAAGGDTTLQRRLKAFH